MYGQKNYLAAQGRHNPVNGRDPIYRIDQIGCLLTAICNFLSRKGIEVDPVALNNWFAEHLVYIDVDDGVLDDLFWGAITAFAPQFTVVATGTGGWPDSDDAIVCFHYKSLHSGQDIDHFCLVADAANHVIVDSYDGLTKTPAQYASVYGAPTKWAKYATPTPQAVEPTTIDNHPYTVPVGKRLFLPAAAGYWRVYPLDKRPVVGNEVGKLWPANPAWAPGLTYEIKSATAYANVYTIQTDTYGTVNIYAGPDTIAQFVDAAPAPAVPVSIPVVAAEPAVAAPVVVDPPIVVAPSPATEAPAWQKTTKNVATYKATENYQVVDLATGLPAAELFRGMTVHAVERFEKDGIEYVMTQKSIDAGKFNGVPLGALKLQERIDIAEPDDDHIFNGLDLEGFADKLEAAKKKVDTKGFRQWLVKLVGEVMLRFSKIKK